MLKLDIFDLLYKEGDINLVVDTNMEGVCVPAYLYSKLANFIVGSKPTPNLEADKTGITAPMRFGGNKFVCHFPWPSIRGMVSRKAVVNFPAEGKNDHEEKAKKSASPLKLIK